MVIITYPISRISLGLGMSHGLHAPRKGSSGGEIPLIKPAHPWVLVNSPTGISTDGEREIFAISACYSTLDVGVATMHGMVHVVKAWMRGGSARGRGRKRWVKRRKKEKERKSVRQFHPAHLPRVKAARGENSVKLQAASACAACVACADGLQAFVLWYWYFGTDNSSEDTSQAASKPLLRHDAVDWMQEESSRSLGCINTSQIFSGSLINRSDRH